MYILKTEHNFDSAHFLAGYEGKCRNLHGHRWRVVVEVKTEELCTDKQHNGMYVDFGDLKNDLKDIVDVMDHALIIERGSLQDSTLRCLEEEQFKILQYDFRPTAENMARYLYDRMQQKGYNTYAVTVYETPNNAATYRE